MNMEKVEVALGDRSYTICIGSGILGNLSDSLKKAEFPRRIAIVTNPTVGELYADRVIDGLEKAGYRAALITVPDGEKFKNLQTLEMIFDALIQDGYDRSSGLVALGGGVIGDMTGFAAATFLRGVPFCQVPTTLVSQVDSSVGGKTGVNHPLGKNLIGAFYQPACVHIDVETLKSLPPGEFASGMAEVVKYGIIRDREFFDWLVANQVSLKNFDPSALLHAVKRSCQIKANVVEVDEKESSVRAILNLGHTFGHAIEALTGYREVRHGEAVAIGTVVIALISHELGLCSLEDVMEIRSLLASFDLPVNAPAFSLDEYLEVMSRDKKVKDGVLRLVLNRGIGDTLIKDVAEPRLLFEHALSKLEHL